MKEIIKTYTIPAQERTETVYVAFDGKEFNSKRECEYYEFKEKINSYFIYQTEISSSEFYESQVGSLFYLRNEDDYNFLLESKGIKKNYGYRYCLTTDFNVFGPGWYLCYCEVGADSYYILNYQYYLEELKKDLKEYEENNYAKMMEKMEIIKGETDNEKS